MTVPDWWEATLLALAAWRTFHLLAHDDILDRPRRYVTRLGPKWKEEGDPVPENYRLAFANWLTCSFCFGFWCALAWWGAWEAWPHGALVAATPFALSAGVIAAAKALSD